MKSYRLSPIVAVSAVVLAACAVDSEPEPRVSEKPTTEDISRPYKSSARLSIPSLPDRWRILFPDDLGDGERIRGYWHTREKSRFARGDGSRSFDDTDLMRQEVSANGLFLEYANGFSAGIPNGDAASWQIRPYSDDADAHAQRVIKYFLESGLPQEQIGETTLNTWMKGGGPSVGRGPNGDLIAMQVMEEKSLRGYVAIIHRRIAGVLVDDSHAWALLNANEDATYEQVWWPDLRASIVEEVRTFQAQLRQPGWLEGLPKKGEGGNLAIHHATPTGETWFSTVTYDMAGDGEILHFDMNGQKVVPAAWKSPPDSVRY